MPVRVLCLGNDLLADDAFGLVVAGRLRQMSLPKVEVLQTAETGFRLLDYIQGVSRLLVVDTVLTGLAQPGTVSVLNEEDLRTVPGGSPHYIGLFETLAAGRRLGLPVPSEVLIVAVEAADCFTVGGAMHPAVAAAVPEVLRLVRQLVHSSPGSKVQAARSCPHAGF